MQYITQYRIALHITLYCTILHGHHFLPKHITSYRIALHFYVLYCFFWCSIPLFSIILHCIKSYYQNCGLLTAVITTHSQPVVLSHLRNHKERSHLPFWSCLVFISQNAFESSAPWINVYWFHLHSDKILSVDILKAYFENYWLTQAPAEVWDTVTSSVSCLLFPLLGLNVTKRPQSLQQSFIWWTIEPPQAKLSETIVCK